MAGVPAKEMRRADSDDRLLLRELTHRTGNEFALAVSALRLASVAKGSSARRRLFDTAISRLEASSAVHRLLAAPVPRQVDAGTLVREVCRKVVEARPAGDGSSVHLEADCVLVPGEYARRVALVAAELVANAVRHALHDRAGVLTVRLDRVGDEVRLMVADDGGGIRPGAVPSGTGWGRGIVSELVDRAHGRMSVGTGPQGTVVTVLLPASDEAEDGRAC